MEMHRMLYRKVTFFKELFNANVSIARRNQFSDKMDFPVVLE
jgi:hypothetical protein